jgi:multidrug efflux pump subunit AcrB
MYPKRKLFLIFFVFLLLLVGVYGAYAWTQIPVDQDPLVRMPGTQPRRTRL